MLGNAATSIPVDGDARNTQLRRCVAYYRVSTKQQSRFGFSLEAQRASVAQYIGANRGKLIAEYAESMSGRNDARPKLTEALYLCKVFKATLLIARLDRLSRNVAMIARLIESKVDFVAVDFPHANRFTLHILAAIAEHESPGVGANEGGGGGHSRARRGLEIAPVSSPSSLFEKRRRQKRTNAP